jgi:hypothetical protein
MGNGQGRDGEDQKDTGDGKHIECCSCVQLCSKAVRSIGRKQFSSRVKELAPDLGE